MHFSKHVPLDDLRSDEELRSIEVTVPQYLTGVPTLYEHYTQGGISSGLTTYPEGFLLNGKNITIIAGVIHYFRVHPEYWRDRLRKLRAAGFNAVQTYTPWNLHEPYSGEFDFGNGSNDFSMFLNFTKFMEMAQEEDLLVVARPGPWINAEWETGGVPSWLLKIHSLRLRSSNGIFIGYMNRYFDQLFPILHKLQFTEGGPLIALQIENEFGLMERYRSPCDTAYLEKIYQAMVNHSLTVLKFTMDNPLRSYKNGSCPGVMMTANFETNAKHQLAELKKLQPDQPFWVTEFYPGWFDNWFDKQHATRTTEDVVRYLQDILDQSSSVSIYMFIGGTTFGFMNGVIRGKARGVSRRFQVTSYDYDALLTEAGDYTEKYNATVPLVKKYLKVETKLPERPRESVKEAYGAIPYTSQLTIGQLIDQVKPADRVQSENVIAMEMMSINNGSGQSYGFVVYRKKGIQITQNSTLKIMGNVHDMAYVMVDGVRKTQAVTSAEDTTKFGCWHLVDGELTLDAASVGANKTLDIMVENMGRRVDKKGLYDGDVLLGGQALRNWEVVALQFHTSWVKSLTDWQKVSMGTGPVMYRAILNVSTPHDTFLDMSSWGKGSVFVNGFNIGRYFSVGPLHSLYVPAPFLHEGTNEIMIFELFTPASHVTFINEPILDNKK